jgi:hypothetical protein
MDSSKYRSFDDAGSLSQDHPDHVNVFQVAIAGAAAGDCQAAGNAIFVTERYDSLARGGDKDLWDYGRLENGVAQKCGAGHLRQASEGGFG